MLLAPLALLLSVLAIPIVLMYVLKLRRQEYRVPSTFLWRQVMEDVQANAPWQRLRFNILLLLQLLALAAVILSLARPAFSRSHAIAGDLIVVVDQSYGMQAHDVRPSRFAVALQRARTLAGQISAGHSMTVIGMGAQPHLVVADSTDPATTEAAIDRLRVGIDQPNFLEALSLATSLARSGQSTRVVVLTSRDSGISSLPLPVTFPVDIVRIGGNLRDLGITGFSASPTPSGVEAVGRVSNFGGDTAHSDLELFVNGYLRDDRPITVAAHSERNYFWSDLPAGASRLHVQLTRTDSMSTDKSAWAAVPSIAVRHVLLISRGNYFLEAALVDLPTVHLSVVPPAAYRPGMESGYDLTIFDHFLPPAFPAGSALVIAPPRGRLGPLRFAGNVPGGQVQPSPNIMGTPASVLKYVDLSDVHVAQVRALKLPGWLQPLATAGSATALAAGQYANNRFALIDFDLQHSDWPLRISFPVALENLVPYLAPGLTLGATNLGAGQPLTLFPPPETREIVVERPGGGIDRLGPPFPPFTDTSHTGLYTVRAIRPSLEGQSTASGGLTASFAVNFFPARPAPAAGPSTLHIGQVRAGQTLTASVPVSVVWVFELLALGVLSVEWWIAFHGARLT